MKKNQKHRRQQSDKSLVFMVFGAVLMLAGFVMAAVLQDPREAAAADNASRSVVPVAVEFTAPELALDNVQGSRESLADFRGQVVLVNNWATWCPPCKAEMPSLQKFYQVHSEEGFTIIAVSAGDAKPEVEQFVESYGLSFNIWLDPGGTALHAFRNNNLPNSYVIDRDGIVRYAWTGEISYEMLEKYVTPVIQGSN